MATADIFNKIAKNIAKNPEKATSADAVFQFNITGDDAGTFILDLREGTTESFLSTEASEDPSVTITIADEDWADITSGSVGAMQAFMMGKIKVDGDINLAMKLQSILAMAG